MRCRKFSHLAPLFVLALLATTQARAAAEEARAAKIYRQVLRSTADIQVPSLGSGTGWVGDRSQRLIVTNQHVVGKKEHVQVLFPAYRDGEVIAESSYYLKAHVKPIRGLVICISIEQDLAVIQLDSLPDNIEELSLAARSPSAGESVYSVGNPGASGAFWVFTSGRVRAVYRKRFPTTLPGRPAVWRHARIVETSSATNPGDSGGPVVNERCELVAVTESAHPSARLVTSFIDVSEVKQFVAESRRIMNPQTTDDYYLRGWRFALAGRFDQAIKDYTDVLLRNEKNAWAYNGRGNCLLAKKDYDTAIADYNEAIRLDPQYDLAYRNRGLAFFQKGKYDDAVADLTRAIRLKPGYALAFHDRALCYERRRQFETAIADYTRAIALYKEKPESSTSDAFASRAFCYGELKDYDKAIADCNIALALNPYMAWVWSNRGFYQYSKKNYGAALQDALTAIKLKPSIFRAWNTLGDVAFVKRDYRAAIAAYTQAIRYNQRNAHGYYWRGRAHQALGHNDQAEADFTRAAELDQQSRMD
jgi:tetratricopeptide (TPR) repeat protein